MKDVVSDSLEAAYADCSMGKTAIKDYLKFIEETLPKCENMQDVDTLMFYALRDDWAEGLAACERLAEKSLLLRKSNKLLPISHQGRNASATYEILEIAKHFAQFGKPQSSLQFLKYFDLAAASASSRLDYEILVTSLAAACRNIDGQTLDPGYQKCRALIDKAFKLAIEDKSSACLDSLAYTAENDIGDKKLAKQIKDARKKLK
jgi:hypothetical protein